MKFSTNLILSLIFFLLGCGPDKNSTVAPADVNKLRIVSLAPSITEWVKAFKATDILVGCTDFCQIDPEENNIHKVGGLTTPSLEAILKLNPTHILASNLTPIDVLEQLKSGGAKVQALDFESLASIRASAETMSLLIHEIDPAIKILDEWDQAFDIHKDTNRPRPPIDVVVLFGSEGLYSAGKETYVEQLIQRAGGVNLPSALNSRWPQIAEEKLIEMNPDLLIIHYDEKTTKDAGRDKFLMRWAKRPQWNQIKAIKNNQLLIMTDSELSIPGPDLLKAFLSIQSKIQTIPPNAEDPTP